ncbi:MAG: M20 family metallopeptidase [Acidobacteria bacterium]|nr:M20 family metallopeptidase [Acidobacteriota bacterium]
MATSLIETLADLVRINSVNPAYANGRAEREIQDYVTEFFRSRGIEVREQMVLPDRPNVIATLPGSNAARRLVLEAHCDTAGVEGMDTPFHPVVRSARLYGRGACDTKAGLAAMMHAIADVHASSLAPPCEVVFVSAMDEEHSCQGATRLCKDLRASGAVIAEPTGLRMVRASKGCVRWRVTVHGRAAHSSKPHLGANAIVGMAELLRELDVELLGEGVHPLVGGPTMNVGQIEGGTQVNIVPERCAISIDRRLIPGEDPADVMLACQNILDRFRAVHPDLRAEMEAPSVQDWPLDTPAASDIVRVTGQVLAGIGLDAEPIGVPFGSDASKFGRAGIPAIILGPGSIDVAHTPDEYVPIVEVERACLVYRRLIEVFE